MAALSGLWFPLQVLPAFLQDAAWLLPPFHLSRLALESVGLGRGSSAWLHFASLLLVTVVALWVAHWGMSRAKRR